MPDHTYLHTHTTHHTNIQHTHHTHTNTHIHTHHTDTHTNTHDLELCFCYGLIGQNLFQIQWIGMREKSSAIAEDHLLHTCAAEYSPGIAAPNQPISSARVKGSDFFPATEKDVVSHESDSLWLSRSRRNLYIKMEVPG